MRLVKKIAVVSALFLPGKFYNATHYCNFFLLKWPFDSSLWAVLHAVVLSLNIISFPRRRLALKKML